MTITEARKKAVDFSDPYYDVPSSFIAKQGAFADHSPRNAEGQEDRRAAEFAARCLSRRDLQGQRGRSRRQGNRGLHGAGRWPRRCSLWLLGCLGGSLLKKPEGKGLRPAWPAIRIGAGSGVGIAVRKGGDALREKINAALKAIKADGTYKKLADKYLTFDISGS